MNRLRRATIADLPFLISLENDSFEESRRVDRKSIKNSLESNRQEVWILEYEGVRAASTTIFLHSKTTRIYSIAVAETHRGHSIGKLLMEHIIQRSKQLGSTQITLEADAMNLKLIHWYESFGFRGDYEIADFYGPGRPAFRMFLELTQQSKFKKGKPLNLVVVDQSVPWLESIDSIKVVRAEEYFTNETYTVEKGIRVFNMCSSYAYQSIGYYVSLLASARNQHVIPNVATIKDFSDSKITELIGEEEYDLMQKSLSSIRDNKYILNVFFGITTTKKYAKLGKSLYRLFEAPLLEFYFEKTSKWDLKRVSPLPISEIGSDESLFEYAKTYFNQRRFMVGRFKDYKYDLAILIDPNEKTPPSNRIALGKFKLAAQKTGFYTEFITKDDFQRLNEFDALFIRVTTNVNDYTYQFSRYAYAEGLIVIDDPWSILKCSNKLFFAESMKRENVLTPKSIVISKYTELTSITDQLNFPMVLKEPDNSFSLGVFKVNDYDELQKTLTHLFQTSELVIAQDFLKSSFDWRVGVLDSKPLFACKYYMAKNHWQILNWNAKKKRDFEGNVETLSVEMVPKNVLSTAVKAASVMGDGFYGVDLKEIDGKVYVIEVNDNPNVDYRHEDIILENELYLAVMKSLFNRIESQRSVKRTISKEK